MFFSYTTEPDNFIPLPIDRVKEVIEMNKNGIKPEDLLLKPAFKVVEKKPDYENVVGQDSLTRFDQKRKTKHKNNNKKRNPGSNNNKPLENTREVNIPADTSPVNQINNRTENPNRNKQNNNNRRPLNQNITPKGEQTTNQNQSRPNNNRNKPNNRPSRPNNNNKPPTAEPKQD